MIAILKVIILLGVLVIIHEFSHMMVARACKVKVLEFSVGFGPQIYGITKNGTHYSVRLIPLGGYVNMLGSDDKNCKEEGSYQNTKLWQKILILLAGSITNIVFGLVIYFILVLSMSNFGIAWEATKEFLFSLFESVKMLFTGGVTPDQLMGPIGITELVSETTEFSDFIYLMSIVSLSLGITNLLPVPPLDGSKVVIAIFEVVRRKTN